MDGRLNFLIFHSIEYGLIFLSLFAHNLHCNNYVYLYLIGYSKRHPLVKENNLVYKC